MSAPPLASPLPNESRPAVPHGAGPLRRRWRSVRANLRARLNTFSTLLVVASVLLIPFGTTPAAAAGNSGPSGAAGRPDRPEQPAEDRPVRTTIQARGNASNAPTGYAPGQVRRAYGFDLLANDGSGQIIGIVDAFDAPNIAKDLQKFITTFGLRPMNGLPGRPACTVAAGPHPCFQKLMPQGKPRFDPGWALEISLDVQWAHAIAPGADILLVEALDSRLGNMMGAVDAAVQQGATVVSMSWGAPEFAGETTLDFHFNRPGVTFTAASGDNGTGVIYPAASPFVLAVGGTTLTLDSSGNRTAPEVAWIGSGGGISAFEAQPAYQASFPIPATGGKRGVPDVAYNANPATGFAVFDSTGFQGQKGWFRIGGTSAGAPQWAGLMALANQARQAGGAGTLSSSSLSVSPVYAAAGSAVLPANYRDVSSGTNGTCGTNCTATVSYDFVTGLGSPLANSLVPFLATH